jgi:dolichol-phosphate mannosyltransferase
MKGVIRGLWDEFGRQGLKYCIVGAVGFLMSYGLLYALTEYCGIYYIYSNLIGTVIGQCVAFLGYKNWAFVLKTGRQMYSTWFQFLVHWSVWGVGLVIATAILYALTTYIHMWYMFSSLLATVASATSNFLSHKYFTYRPEKSPELLQQAPRIRERL